MQVYQSTKTCIISALWSTKTKSFFKKSHILENHDFAALARLFKGQVLYASFCVLGCLDGRRIVLQLSLSTCSAILGVLYALMRPKSWKNSKPNQPSISESSDQRLVLTFRSYQSQKLLFTTFKTAIHNQSMFRLSSFRQIEKKLIKFLAPWSRARASSSLVRIKSSKFLSLYFPEPPNPLEKLR